MEKRSRAVKEAPQATAEVYWMQLFVVGDEPNSRRARENLLHLCEQHLKGRCRLGVVDVLKDYQRALDNGVLVAPTLIVQVGDRKVIVAGSLSDTEAVLAALQLSEQD